MATTDCWWCEFVTMFRKVALVAVAILSDDAFTAFVLSTIIIAAAIAIHLKFKPYNSGGHKIEPGEDEGTYKVVEEVEEMVAADKLVKQISSSVLRRTVLAGRSAHGRVDRNVRAGRSVQHLVLMFGRDGRVLGHYPPFPAHHGRPHRWRHLPKLLQWWQE